MEEVARDGAAVSDYPNDERDGTLAPEQPGEPKPDPYAYWDELDRPPAQFQGGLGIGGLGRGYGMNLVPLANDLAVLIWMLVKLVFKLVTWPIRWTWKKSRGTVLQ